MATKVRDLTIGCFLVMNAHYYFPVLKMIVDLKIHF